MKKVMCLILSLVMIVAFAGCSDKGITEPQTDSEPVNNAVEETTTEPVTETTTAETTTAETTTAETTTMAPETTTAPPADGENIKDTILKMIDDTIDVYTGIYLSGDEWDYKGLREYFGGWIIESEDLQFTTEKLLGVEAYEIANMLKEKAHKKYDIREAEFGDSVMREVERVVLLRNVDSNWMDHIDAMDQLRQGIGLRGYGQHNPVVEYRNESYDMFSAMTDSIREQTAKMSLSVRVRKNEEVKREKVAEETSSDNKPLTVKGKGVVSKNALCPCGSGKKYKRCCGKDED